MVFDFLFKRRAKRLADKRHYKRFDVSIEATIACDGHFIPVSLRDLSQHGARAYLSQGHPPSNIVWLHWRGFEKMARVAWSNDSECGLHFSQPLTLEEVDKILAAQAPAPAR